MEERVAREDRPRRPLPGSFVALAPAAVHHGPRGSFYFYQPAPDVIYTQAVGHMDLGCADAFKAFGDGTFARAPKTVLFHDWSEITGYDSETRAVLTRWTIEHRSDIATVVVLVRSKLLAMGVATANLATSPLGVTFHSHTSREVFEKEFLTTMRRH